MQWIKLDQNTITAELFSQLEYLESVCGLEPFSTEMLEESIYELDTYAWLDEDILAGFITIQAATTRSGGGIYIVNLNVNPAYRRQGLGHSLMLTALAQYGCTHQGCTVALDVAKKNQPAIALYQKLGFLLTDIPSGNGPSDHVMIAKLDQLLGSCVTDQLILRPMVPEDAELLGGILMDDKVKVTYMVPDLDEVAAKQLANRIIKLSYNKDRYVRGIYQDSKLIGLLNDVEITDGSIELGWVIAPAEHNKGYATEAVTAAISDLFAKGYQHILAGAFRENEASIRVMIKAGMHPIAKTELIDYRNQTHHCVYFEVSCE